MSTFVLVIAGLVAEAICNSIASVFAFFCSDDSNMKNIFFHTYNRLLIIAAVVYFFVFSSNNVEHPYLVTIGFYIYGLICEAIGMATISWHLKNKQKQDVK